MGKLRDAVKRLNLPPRNTSTPTTIAQTRSRAAPSPLWPALWISLAAVDSGNGSSGSSTMTRRSSVTKRIPKNPPTINRALDLAHAMRPEKLGQQSAMRNAGIVNTAPAAIDSPIEPMVRAMFSSRIEPLNSRSTAMPMMAAG